MNRRNKKSFKGIGIVEIITVLLLLSFLQVEEKFTFGAQSFQLKSPDNNVVIIISLKENRTPYPKGTRVYYEVFFNGSRMLRESWLGLKLQKGPLLDRDFSLIEWNQTTVNDKYTMPYGTQGKLHGFCHQGILKLKEYNETGRRINFVFRAYNEGIAFRYMIPQQPKLHTLELAEENSTFYFPTGSRGWALQLKSYTTNYESEFNAQPLWQIRPGSILGLPLLIETLQGKWMAVTEANITNYAGMYLTPRIGNPETFESCLSPHPLKSKPKVQVRTPMHSPWRVFLLGNTPGTLIENNSLLLHLNAPSRIADTSWIRPGKAAWHWWNGTVAKQANFKEGMNTDTMLHYVNFAADHNLEYFLIDDGWHQGTSEEGDITRNKPGLDLDRVIRYAKKKKVGILLWLHWKRAQAQMKEAFRKYEEWGIAGVKIDFMNRDDQAMVQLYHRIAFLGAKHRLLINLHGAYKPDGLRRTWPNLITREAVLGLEWNKFSTRCNPLHDVTLPFTRMLAGPMDYTPGAFRTVSRKDFRSRSKEPVAQGTRCHQLAMYVVYESPLQMLVDYPAAYKGKVGLEFLKRVPTSWDATRVIQGQVGEYITVARKKGNEWYVGSLTNWKSRELHIPLKFLGAGKYIAEVYSDVPPVKDVSKSINQKRFNVNSKTVVVGSLNQGGGHAMYIFPDSESTN